MWDVVTSADADTNQTGVGYERQLLTIQRLAMWCVNESSKEGERPLNGFCWAQIDCASRLFRIEYRRYSLNDTFLLSEAPGHFCTCGTRILSSWTRGKSYKDMCKLFTVFSRTLCRVICLRNKMEKQIVCNNVFVCSLPLRRTLLGGDTIE